MTEDEIPYIYNTESRDGTWEFLEVNGEIKLAKFENEDFVSEIKMNIAEWLDLTNLALDLQTKRKKSLISMSLHGFTNNIADLELARLLKQTGFNEPTLNYWQDANLPFSEPGRKSCNMPTNHNKYDSFVYSAPTKEQFWEWFEKWNGSNIIIVDATKGMNANPQDL